MQLSRAILVLGAEWACLAGGVVGGMAIERHLRFEDIGIILASVAALAFAAGSAFRRASLTERHECNTGSLLFLLTSIVVNLMMVRDGTDGHIAASALCAAVAAAVFHVAATRSSPATPTTDAPD
jgi:drug/metabolite transporter (DMT)-like permease